MNARELLGILDAKERHWSGGWWFGLEAFDEDMLKISIWSGLDERRLESSYIICNVSSLYTPEECAEDIIRDMRSAMLLVLMGERHVEG